MTLKLDCAIITLMVIVFTIGYATGWHITKLTIKSDNADMLERYMDHRAHMKQETAVEKSGPNKEETKMSQSLDATDPGDGKDEDHDDGILAHSISVRRVDPGESKFAAWNANIEKPGSTWWN
jgi:hypothetical protein